MTLHLRTRLCGVIGDPIEHSLSPVMHNAAFRELGLDYAYFAFHVPKESLKPAILGVVGLGIVGLNVTIPHKLQVLRYLDHVDEEASRLGAVNTVINRDGRLYGCNTDGIGALRALEQNGVTVKGKRSTLMGAGGASRAIAFKLSEHVRSMTILNRTKSRAASLARSLRRYRNIEVKVKELTEENLSETLRETDILINATPIGMWPNVDVTPVRKELLPSGLTVFDIVYNPIQTRLLHDASKRGCRVIDGVDMLVHQGAPAFKLWTGREAPIEVMRKAVLRALKRKFGS